MGKVIKLKVSPITNHKMDKIKQFAAEVVKLNADKLGNLIEHDLQEGETPEYLINKYTDAVLGHRASQMSAEAIAAEIRDGYFIAMRDSIIQGFYNDPVIKFYLNNEMSRCCR